MSTETQEHILYGLVILAVAAALLRLGSCIEAEEVRKTAHAEAMRKLELDAMRSAPCPPAAPAAKEVSP